jgi:hypothetical protein
MRLSVCAIVVLLIPVGLLLGQPERANDWTIVPGERVGPITGKTVRQDLDRYFSKQDVEDGELELDEGMLQPGAFVYKSNPSQALAVVWNGKGPQATPKQIFVCFGRRRGDCRWQLSNGIKVGTRLTELEAMNGKSFTISGFGWNYGGNVLSWDGGKLEKLDCNGRVVLTMDAERRSGEYTVNLTSEEKHSMTGDKPVSSQNAAMRKLNPGVVEMVFYFAGSDSKRCN